MAAGSEVGGEGVVRLLVEQHEAHLLHRHRVVCPCGLHRDAGRVVERPAVDTRRDRGEGHRRSAQLLGDAQRLAVGGGERGGAVLTLGEDRSDGVDDPPRGQVAGRRRDGLPGRQSVRQRTARSTRQASRMAGPPRR